ncbi:OmpA/MotB family protein [Flavihumibacter petaseus]|uniref:OmpA family protein n=1 Tax=Flavihumibacter petaseus NBRC 106054 TaxID=1220578 RepID=A0A0E9MYL8_9BACT|nr:OmpA family protein [Flavihumibacter petaseus]GAO42827.1 OmpA family protein [Flavihumibacter petaseus NBRC 106054]
MKVSYLVLAACASLSMVSCVSSKKFKAEQAKVADLTGKNGQLTNDLKACDDAKAEEARKRAGLETDVANLNKQIDLLKENNTSAIKQLQDLSVISSQQAESIKKSMDNLGLKDAYIQDLQTQMAKKDSLNMALVMNLKGAIGNLDDQDINIKVEKGVVFVDISDKLLFNSGSYSITPRAKEVLGKVATVLKAQPDLEFMVEGHTDNKELKGNIGPLKDNWDLSVFRATAVVKILQKTYGMDPMKMAAAGRGEYKPIADNTTAEGRAANRRTRIVILPQLDQFYKLLEKKS